MKTRRYALAVLLLTLPGAGLVGACSRLDKAAPEPAQGSPPKASSATPTQREAGAITSASHAAPAPPRADLSGNCERICAASSKLNCPQAKACQRTCLAMGSTGVCETELGAFYACLQRQASEHWECLEDGSAAIREGHCEGEQATFAQCLHEK